MDNHWDITIGIAVFVAALLYLVKKSESVYFGQSILCVFMVASASLAGYAHSAFFQLSQDWVSPSHLTVLRYSILGCLAMLAGLGIAWRRKRGKTKANADGRIWDIGQTQWINPAFGWFMLVVGTLAILVDSIFYRVATLGTAVHSLTSFSTFGLLVLLAVGLKRHGFGHLAIAMAVYVPAVLMQAFSSGHTPAKVSLLLPAACLVAGFRRIDGRSVATIAVCGYLFLALMSGWMETRRIIRGGDLAGMSFTQKVARFLPAWFDATWDKALDMEAQNYTIRERVDMTDIMAMQVRYQPRHEPFARGQTVLDAGVALIPRALWPRKPVIAGGSAFVSKYTGMVRDPRDTTSIGLPYQFELYANGGPICVVIGLFVVGFVCGTIERGLFVPTASLASLLARISITMTLCDGGQRTDIVLPSLIAGAATYFVLGKAIESALPDLATKLLGHRRPTVKQASPLLPKEAPALSRVRPRS